MSGHLDKTKADASGINAPAPDYDAIWLGPRCMRFIEREGVIVSALCEREWCQDNVWGEGCSDCGARPTRYIRDRRTGRGCEL